MGFLAVTVFKIIADECIKNVTALRSDKPSNDLRRSQTKYYIYAKWNKMILFRRLLLESLLKTCARWIRILADIRARRIDGPHFSIGSVRNRWEQNIAQKAFENVKKLF